MDTQHDNLEPQEETRELRKRLAEHESKLAVLSEFYFDNITNTFIKKDNPAYHACPACLIKFKVVKLQPLEYVSRCPECEQNFLSSNGINRGKSE